MCIRGVGGRLGKTLVPIRKKALLQVHIRLLNRRDSGQPQLLYQPILQGLKTSLDSALGLWTMRAAAVDSQFGQSSCDLCRSHDLMVSAGRSFGGGLGHSRLIRIELQWPAVA